jgi:hypothetical protein
MADLSEFEKYNQLLGQRIAEAQARASSAPTSPLGGIDPAMLALAQGFLAPTKTGAFGESVGSALGAASGPLAAMKKQQLDAQDKVNELMLAQAKLNMEAPYWQRRGLGLTGAGEGTPNSQINALKGELASYVNADSETLAALEARGVDVNQVKADIIAQMAEIRSRMGGKGGDGLGEGTSSSEDFGPIPKITDDAKGRSRYNNLAPGSQYLAPDGSVRTKPAGTGERG